MGTKTPEGDFSITAKTESDECSVKRFFLITLLRMCIYNGYLIFSFLNIIAKGLMFITLFLISIEISETTYG